MLATVYPAETDARRSRAAIEAARGPTETLHRVGAPRDTWTAPAKPWGEIEPLRDGRWVVPWHRTLRAIEGREVTVEGARVRVPVEADAVTIAEAERTRDAEPDAGAGTRTRTP